MMSDLVGQMESKRMTSVMMTQHFLYGDVRIEFWGLIVMMMVIMLMMMIVMLMAVLVTVIGMIMVMIVMVMAMVLVIMREIVMIPMVMTVMVRHVENVD